MLINPRAAVSAPDVIMLIDLYGDEELTIDEDIVVPAYSLSGSTLMAAPFVSAETLYRGGRFLCTPSTCLLR